VLHRALDEAVARIKGGERRAGQVAEGMMAKISSEPLARLDYAACVDAGTLSDIDVIDRPVLLAVAAWVGQARLIDNETATPEGAAIQEG
jgi:pantoate--beta-alanine ligase